MSIFSGLKGFIYTVKNKIPMHYYTTWLKEKWIADLKLVLWAIPFIPFLILWGFGVILMGVGQFTLMTRRFLPDSLFLDEDELRAKQLAAVNAAKIYFRNRNK